MVSRRRVRDADRVHSRGQTSPNETTERSSVMRPAPAGRRRTHISIISVAASPGPPRSARAVRRALAASLARQAASPWAPGDSGRSILGLAWVCCIITVTTFIERQYYTCSSKKTRGVAWERERRRGCARNKTAPVSVDRFSVPQL